MHSDFICVRVRYFFLYITNLTSECKLGFVRGVGGDYFRVRQHAHKSARNTQSCCLLHWEGSAQISWEFAL